MYKFVVLGLMLALNSCSSATLDQQLLQRWQMVSVTIEGQDRAADLNPGENRWIEFLGNGTFLSGSGEITENGGSYALDVATKTLQLDSNAGSGDDSEWRLDLDGNQLTMQGIGTQRQEQSVVVFVKVVGEE